MSKAAKCRRPKTRSCSCPGFPCPLCRFPTYSWVEDMGSKIESYVLDFIRENHPGWDVEFGACDRCVEVYKLRADGVM